jgi:hypothetical protein
LFRLQPLFDCLPPFADVQTSLAAHQQYARIISLQMNLV